MDAGGSGVGTYTLAVTNITDNHPDDYDATTTGTTGTLAIDGSATGDIGHPGDRDWFKVELDAETVYQFDLKGGPTGDGLPGFGTLGDPYLHGIHDSSGTRIAGTSDDDSGVHNYSRVRYRATQRRHPLRVSRRRQRHLHPVRRLTRQRRPTLANTTTTGIGRPSAGR